MRSWVRSYGVRATISNCSNNYGPYQHVEKFIPRQITNVLTGRRPKLYGAAPTSATGSTSTTTTARCGASWPTAQLGRTYLIGADGERDNLSVMRTMLRLMGRDPDDFDHVTDRAGHDLRYAIDPSRAARRIGLGAKAHRLRARACAPPSSWYRDNESWWRPLKDAVEAALRRAWPVTCAANWRCPAPGRSPPPCTPTPVALFFEWFTDGEFTAMTGHRLDLRQANVSVSAAGVLRGLHFAQLPPSQAKYVTCLRGAVFDVVVDIRVGSPTFGRWDSVLLDDRDHRTVYLSEGLAHGFLALQDDSTVIVPVLGGLLPRSRAHHLRHRSRASASSGPRRRCRTDAVRPRRRGARRWPRSRPRACCRSWQQAQEFASRLL